MFCEKCGTKLIENEQFCSCCGMKIAIEQIPTEKIAEPQPNVQVNTVPDKNVLLICKNCKKELEHDWVYCPYCTEPGPKICVKCRKEVKEDWAVCPYCKTGV